MLPNTADPEPSKRVIHTQAEDGRAICIRTIRPGDEPLMRAGIARMSDRSRYLRFFSGARTPPDWVIARLLDSDGDSHLAWGALNAADSDDASTWPAIGSVHAFRDPEHPDCAEFSVAVLDAWHGLGVGKLLTATILLDAQDEEISHFRVDTLAENRSAIAFTLSLGGKAIGQKGPTLSYTLDVAEAIRRLETECEPPGMVAVFEQFRAQGFS